MTQKFIVSIDDGVDAKMGLELVRDVISWGRISEDAKGPCYCFHSVYERDGKSYHVVAWKNIKSDGFSVWMENDAKAD